MTDDSDDANDLDVFRRGIEIMREALWRSDPKTYVRIAVKLKLLVDTLVYPAGIAKFGKSWDFTRKLDNEVEFDAFHFDMSVSKFDAIWQVINNTLLTDDEETETEALFNAYLFFRHFCSATLDSLQDGMIDTRSQHNVPFVQYSNRLMQLLEEFILAALGMAKSAESYRHTLSQIGLVMICLVGCNFVDSSIELEREEDDLKVDTEMLVRIGHDAYYRVQHEFTVKDEEKKKKKRTKK